MKPTAALGIACATLALAATAHATQVFHVPVEKMAVESDVVVHAVVVEQAVGWDDTHSRILTSTTIEVLDAIKGASTGDRLEIYQVGGTVDGVTFSVPGRLEFAPGEEMVFFAMRFGEQLVSFGMGLGKWRVEERDGVAVVTAHYGDVAWVERDRDRWAPAPEPPPDVESLASFLGRLDEVLSSQEAGR